MSRVGKAPIHIPEGAEVKIDRSVVTVKGPKGELSVSVNPEMILDLEGNTLTVKRPSESKTHRSMHGLTRTLIANCVQGVTAGFEKKLEIVGVGYRGEMKAKGILLNLGFSHPILFMPPAGIELSVGKDNVIAVRGINKELVGEIAAKIRALRKPEPYKGKGVRYVG
ncbi:50S ribosomal protein L6, partial [candidate division KSB1 bacterium]|nr:50S ribosomal protein L6 [candidate division KSB1 bacterium]